MTNDLLTKATALLEAEEKATHADWLVHLYHVKSSDGDEIADFKHSEDAAFSALAANTACETIQGYQDLLRQMADAIERLIAGNLDMDELGEAKLLLDEARAALLHTTTNV
jgi:hypothetical protein